MTRHALEPVKAVRCRSCGVVHVGDRWTWPSGLQQHQEPTTCPGAVRAVPEEKGRRSNVPKPKNGPVELNPGDAVRTSPAVGVCAGKVLEVLSRRGRGRYKVKVEVEDLHYGSVSEVVILDGGDLELVERGDWQAERAPRGRR